MDQRILPMPGTPSGAEGTAPIRQRVIATEGSDRGHLAARFHRRNRSTGTPVSSATS